MPHFWKTVGLSAAHLLGAALARLDASDIEGLASHVGSSSLPPRRREALATFAGELLRSQEGGLYDMARNGEALLLERTVPLGFRTLFDVGANHGTWALAAHARHPAATIHCFEIVPETFATLQGALGGREGFVLNPVGLADREGEVEVFAHSSSATSSIYDFGHGELARRRCKVMRGDDYAAARGIERIDLLKIDTEGAESLVIEGFRRMLERRAVRLVQFEYNRGAIESGFLLRNFHSLFGGLGYAVGKLTGQGVLFRDYHHSHEDFVGPNYVACLRDDQALIDLVAARA